MTNKQPVSLFLVVLLPMSVISDSLSTQRSILLSIAYQWGNLSAFSTWSPATSPCSWDGISCSSATGNSTVTVTGIRLHFTIPQFPPSICDLKALQSLDLSSNSMSGSFPTALYGCSSLTHLDLSDNSFAGPIPHDLGRLSSSLTYLDLSVNSFTGAIPKSIGALKALATLRLYNNLFHGAYPAEISNLPNLEDLQTGYNSFTPMALPSEWGSMKSLRILKMAGCNLVGEIPESFGGLVSLEVLDLSDNGLVGRIPLGLTALSRLYILTLERNQLSGHLTLTEPNPWASLVMLNLASNEFSGSIPDAIGSLQNLNKLDLSFNNFSGSIPDAIGSLHYLEELDLSSNDLSGEIPHHFTPWSLRILDLSNNKLSGKIPHSLNTKAFAYRFSKTNLCTTDGINLERPRCPTYLSSFFSKHLVIILVLAIVFLTTLFFTVFAVKERERRKHIDEQLPSWTFIPFHMLEFTESYIITSLSEQHIIGSGASGKVYRVQLNNGSGYSVAVKRIWNNQQVSNAQFLAEVEILGKIRHANIVKLLCCISNENTKLLVYEYMENQSLDRWLHKRRRLESERRGNPLGVLDWPTRLRIAIGAAQGLCYMHHDCGPPIIHRDVKSSNILLDSEFNAKMADFGLARITVKQGELHTVSSVAGTFGYLAPEYISTRKLNEKIDVYSFGVVLLELATGKEPNSRDETLNLADSSWRHCCEDKPIVDRLDEEVMQEEYVEEMASVFRLGLMCTSPLPNSRPTMKDVLHVLRRSSPIEEVEDSNRPSEQSPGES